MFEVVEIGGVKTVAAKAACNHVYIVDVSGSMYSDLPNIRSNLKNIITMVAQPEDTFSVIYFSGRGQCGVVFENLLVSDISTVQKMHDAIDRFIKPIGMTGFLDPIQKAMELSLTAGKVNSFVMMTDGYDNTSNRTQVIEQVKKLRDHFDNVTFIEYGYYADRKMIESMAEACGGTHVFAEGFSQYEGVFSDVVRGTPRVQNIEVKVNKAAKDCIYVYGNSIHIVPVTDGIAVVPEDVGRVHSIVPKDVLSKQLSEDHLYLILFYAVKRNRDELVWNVLQILGDVALIKKYSNAFTKQELSAFEQIVKEAVLEPELRFAEGKDTSAVPDKNAPTVLELLRVLSGANANLVIDSPYWEYNRIGRASVAQEELPKFVPNPSSKVSMNSLVFSSERPNVSINTVLEGVVVLPENEFGMKTIDSHIHRNYTIVKDGIINVDRLPVVVAAEAFKSVSHFSHDVILEKDDEVYAVFNLRNIPVINRAMVENVTLESLCDIVGILNSQKADLKVIKDCLATIGGANSKTRGIADEFGEDAAAWLSSIGVRDYGFSPVGTKQEEATDEYESIQLEVKVKGLSSLPAISAVAKKLSDNKKLTVADHLIASAMKMFSVADEDTLQSSKKLLEMAKKSTEEALAFYVYSLILGRKWFGDDEIVSSVVKFDGGIEAPVTFEKVRKMVKI